MEFHDSSQSHLSLLRLRARHVRGEIFGIFGQDRMKLDGLVFLLGETEAPASGFSEVRHFYRVGAALERGL
jgi:hypothetical protein